MYHRGVRRFIPILLLILANIFVWTATAGAGELTVSFLDVGQGDSILIESPTGVQMLVDGGPDGAVLRELGSRLGFFDRTLDAVVETHPDQDHIGGLPDVFERYRVETFIEPRISNDTSATVAIINAVKNEEDVKKIVARRGMRILLGGGAYADILYPDRDVDAFETNTGSIVMRVVYGSTSFVLTGDSPEGIEKYLVSLDAEGLNSDVLKAGHHGSKTSTSEVFVKAVSPTYGVISAGKDNRYGHPHKDVVSRLNAEGVQILSTAERGAVTFVSDGRLLEVK